MTTMTDSRKQLVLKAVEKAMKNGDKIIFTGGWVGDVVSLDELRQVAASYGREAEVIDAARNQFVAPHGSR